VLVDGAVLKCCDEVASLMIAQQTFVVDVLAVPSRERLQQVLDQMDECTREVWALLLSQGIITL
jgi:hypothetical protein